MAPHMSLHIPAQLHYSLALNLALSHTKAARASAGLITPASSSPLSKNPAAKCLCSYPPCSLPSLQVAATFPHTLFHCGGLNPFYPTSTPQVRLDIYPAASLLPGSISLAADPSPGSSPRGAAPPHTSLCPGSAGLSQAGCRFSRSTPGLDKLVGTEPLPPPPSAPPCTVVCASSSNSLSFADSTSASLIWGRDTSEEKLFFLFIAYPVSPKISASVIFLGCLRHKAYSKNKSWLQFI